MWNQKYTSTFRLSPELISFKCNSLSSIQKTTDQKRIKFVKNSGNRIILSFITNIIISVIHCNKLILYLFIYMFDENQQNKLKFNNLFFTIESTLLFKGSTNFISQQKYTFIYNLLDLLRNIYINCLLLNSIESVKFIDNEVTFIVYRSYLLRALFLLKTHCLCKFNMLVDIIGVDYPNRNSRFDVIYNLLSLQYNSRARVKIIIDEISPIDSVCNLYNSANWLEREVWDMYGVFFFNHPDLRRILTDYGFDGHPFRKEFPLSGYTELRYDDIQKRIVSESVELSQEFRSLKFPSPWVTNIKKL